MYSKMKKGLCGFIVLMTVMNVVAQSVSEKLSAAFTAFENDSQLKSGLASIYVIDGTSGNVIFEKNSRIGLAPASTQKIITAATAYELLGKEFHYETKFGYYGSLKNGQLDGAVVIEPSGDPTLGSWRWQETSENAVLTRLRSALKEEGIFGFSNMVMNDQKWEGESIPGGWIWDDVANYYGAGANAFNWRENQYDLILKSGKNIGDPVTVVGTKPGLFNYHFFSTAKSAAKGTGDNSYIYFSPDGSPFIVRGTIPINEIEFVISGAMPDPFEQFFSTLKDSLAGNFKKTKQNNNNKRRSEIPAGETHYFHTETSPPLDSIIYWFLKKSINLYGEALAKTIALKKDKTASTENGVEVIRNYWKEKSIGIDETELNMIDGSGLSPQNRVTTHAEVSVLQYAQSQPWFAGYYKAFPEFNGMKLKSGTIGGAKSFCGYHTSKEGKSYIVSFIVNNYNGSSSSLVQKMYKVLDVLK